jgi:PLAT/LH2 domain
MKTCFKTLFLSTILTTALVTPSSAKVISYCISSKTWTESGAGTDNRVYLILKSAKGQSDEFELQGSKENDGVDEFTHDTKDIGRITTLSINVWGQIADHWSPNYIRVYRNTNCAKKEEDGGWSEFAIQKSLPYGANDYDFTDGADAAMSVSPSGKLVVNSKEITIVNYSNNAGSQDQKVNLVSESWSDVDSVQISNSSEDTVGAGASISYESPETVVGTFSAEVSASWSRTLATLKTTSHETANTSSINWEFTAPAKTFIMRKATFKVPYAEQIYEDSSGGKYAIRKVGARIEPTGASGDFIDIPNTNKDGSIEPVSLQDLDNEWFAYLSPKEVSNIKRKYMAKWISSGYVVDGDVPVKPVAKPLKKARAPVVAQVQPEPDPTPPPKKNTAPVVAEVQPEPDPTPPPPPPTPVKKKKQQVASAAASGINGANLTMVTHAGGRLEKTGDAEWTEFNADGEASFVFQETGRDEWSVYLNDDSRNVQLQLNVHRKMVSFGEGGGAKQDLYPITSMK